ncbi:MAG: hypothetical protein FJX75_20145 [Armatimonadetes bacterium]|nr:hypothetical protein [Armatimonadota bacterium]
MSFCYAVIALTAMLSLGLVFMHVARNSSHWASTHALDKRAEYLAESGVHRAIWMIQFSREGESLINDIVDNGSGKNGVVRTYQSPQWQLPGGSYSFKAVGPYKGMPYTLAITGTGIARTAGRTVPAQSFAMVRVFNPKAPASGSPAAYSNYAVFSNHNAQIKDYTKIYGHPEYGGKGVYVNGRLKFKGKPVVYGDIRVTGRFHDLRKVGPWPPGEYKREQRVPREPMPTVDLAYYKSIADEVYSHDLRIDGRKHTSTSLQKPRIIYVEHDVTLKGNLEGYGIIVAGHKVTIDGDVKYGSSQSGWAIICAGKVKIKHDAEVHGGIYAHSTKKHKGKVEVEGNAKIFGWIVADTVKLKKKAFIEYDPAIRSMDNLPGDMGPSDKPVVDLMFWGAL